MVSVKNSLFIFVTVVFCTYLLLLHSSLGRPLWIDEFLQFALGAEQSSGNAWSLIRRSILSINHNQTGIYLLLDYWLERAGGANAFLLRLPSIMSGAFFLVCTVRFFRNLSFSYYWIWLALLALLGQDGAMEWLGQARPYFPLAAATAGILVYYITPWNERRCLDLLVGSVSIVIGVMFHPYFSVYWAALVAVTYVRDYIKDPAHRSLMSVLRHANLPLVVTGSTLYTVLALAVWLRHSQGFKLDPFQYVRDPSFGYNFLDGMHFEFISLHLHLVWTVTVLMVIFAALLPDEQRGGNLLNLVTPILLIVAMLALSAVLSVASYLEHYWIIPRQWVASAAVMPLAYVWLWGELSRIYARLAPTLGLLIWIFGLIVVSGQAEQVNSDLFASLMKYAHEKSARFDCNPRPKAPTNAQAWVALANQNIGCGGPVWDVFRGYYGENI